MGKISHAQVDVTDLTLRNGDVFAAGTATVYTDQWVNMPFEVPLISEEVVRLIPILKDASHRIGVQMATVAALDMPSTKREG